MLIASSTEWLSVELIYRVHDWFPLIVVKSLILITIIIIRGLVFLSELCIHILWTFFLNCIHKDDINIYVCDINICIRTEEYKEWTPRTASGSTVTNSECLPWMFLCVTNIWRSCFSVLMIYVTNELCLPHLDILISHDGIHDYRVFIL